MLYITVINQLSFLENIHDFFCFYIFQLQLSCVESCYMHIHKSHILKLNLWYSLKYLIFLTLSESYSTTIHMTPFLYLV